MSIVRHLVALSKRETFSLFQMRFSSAFPRCLSYLTRLAKEGCRGCVSISFVQGTLQHVILPLLVWSDCK